MSVGYESLFFNIKNGYEGAHRSCGDVCVCYRAQQQLRPGGLPRCSQMPLSGATGLAFSLPPTTTISRSAKASTTSSSIWCECSSYGTQQREQAAPHRTVPRCRVNILKSVLCAAAQDGDGLWPIPTERPLAAAHNHGRGGVHTDACGAVEVPAGQRTLLPLQQLLVAFDIRRRACPSLSC